MLSSTSTTISTTADHSEHLLQETRMQELGVGIHGMDLYIPKKYVDQTELEAFDGVSQGKYTIGLGQSKMACVDDTEDINSICLTAVNNLLEKYSIHPDQVGRLEVGTETIVDKSKSVKSVLMSLFGSNTSIEGVDTTNACYGGTNALFNCINWLESSSYDGRYAIAVAADIAVYKSGNARPTGGAGAVAILLGRNAPLVFDIGTRATHVEHVWDFYKPDLHSEYPEVDGPLSNMCYTRAVDICYQRFLDKLSQKEGAPQSLDNLDFVLFHSPYTKLVQKSFGRLAYNDFKRNPENPKYESLASLDAVPEAETYTNKEIEKGFMALTKNEFLKKVHPSLLVAKNMGNMYCGSLYGGLASLLATVAPEDLVGSRVALFSYGSGLASSMFSLSVKSPPTEIHEKLQIQSRLDARTKVSPAEFDDIMLLREATHNVKSYQPKGSLGKENLFEGTWYLAGVDEKFRRTYSRV